MKDPMKIKLCLALCAGLFYTEAEAQQLLSSAYYKDDYLSKQVPEKKAAFREERFLGADGAELRRVTRLKDGVVVKESKRRGQELLGTWFAISGKDTLYVLNYDLLVYCTEDTAKNTPPSVDTVSYTAASFPGGEETMYAYLSKELEYPVYAREMSIMGTVYIRFTVMTDGRVRFECIYQGAHSSLDLEARRVILSMPRWTPALLNGVPVEVSFLLPLDFKLM